MRSCKKYSIDQIDFTMMPPQNHFSIFIPHFMSLRFSNWSRRLTVLALCLAALHQPLRAADENTTACLNLDAGREDLAMHPADEGKSEGRITGMLPQGWHDNSAWAKVMATYKMGQEDGQKFVVADIQKIDDGKLQIRQPIGDYENDSIFMLKIRMRAAPNMPVEFGIRQMDAPNQFAWVQRETLEGSWRTYEYLFNLDHNTQPMAFLLSTKSCGQLNIASIKLERVSKAALGEELKKKYPDGGPRNLLRATRLPMGLQSGWTMERYRAQTNIETVCAPDAGVKGVSGVPSIHWKSDTEQALFSEPFNVPLPFQKYTASVYVRGSGKGTLAVQCERKTVSSKPFELGGEWTRVEVPFNPKFGARFYDLQLTAEGEIWMDAWQVNPGERATPYASQYPAEVSLACVARETAAAKVQFTDEPAQVAYEISLNNNTKPGKTWKLCAKVVDLYGESRELEPVAIKGSGLVSGTFAITPFAERQNGSLRVEAWVQNETGERVSPFQEIIIHRLQRPRYWGKDAPDSPFGVHVDADTPHLQMAKASGVNWVRLHDAGLKWIGWYYLERQPGQWSFADEAIGRYRSHHLKILGCLETTPEWAGYFEKPHWKYFDMFYQPKDLQQYANYVKVVAERYRGVIDAYDIWNEPWNAAWFSHGFDETKTGRAGFQPSADPQGFYLELLKVANATLKAVDPAIRVVAINTTTQEVMNKPYPDLSGVDWTRRLKELHAERECDILDYHQYESAFQGFPGDIVEHGLKVALGPFFDGGVKKPVWNTETSPLVGHISSGFYNHTLPYRDAEDVLDTGNRLCRQMLSLLSVGVSKTFLYSMGGYQYFGYTKTNPWIMFVSEDGALHPSACAYSAMAWRIEDTKFEKCLPLGGQNFAYLFRGQGRTVAVIAPAQATRGLELPVVEDWKLSDMLGNPFRGRAISDNRLVYIESAKGVDEVEAQLAKITLKP